jgi:hypothetical protein
VDRPADEPEPQELISPEPVAPEPPPRLVALEFVLDEVGPALELFVDHLGFTLVDRYPHPALDAEVFVLDAEPIAITILRRTAYGDRPGIPPSVPNLTQLIFDVSSERLAALRGQLTAAGAAVIDDGPAMFHLGRQLTTAALGVSPSLVFHAPPPS